MLAVIDCRTPLACRKSLETRGFSLLPLPPFPALAVPVMSHPDMLIFPIGNTVFCHRAYYTIAKEEIDILLHASGLSLLLTDDTVSPVYPEDVSLNLVSVGGMILGKPDAMSKKVKEYAAQQNIPIIPVRQGYTKCSSVVLKNALITADTNMASAARSSGLDVLTISPGSVNLPGYSYGFLGGSCGVYGDTVFFCGDLDCHPDAAPIRRFCQAHGYTAVSLSDEPLLDVGTMFFF